jgi:hypothetical protein
MSEEKKARVDEQDEAAGRPRGGYTREGLEEAGAGFLRALGDGLGALLDQGSKELESIARTGKAQYDIVQAKRDRSLAFKKLGREIFERWEAGEIELEGLAEVLGEIQQLNESIDAHKQG